MKMQQIRYFLALCDELNFRGAAKRSGVSQPTLTKAIAGLERKLGGALFERKPQVALTPLGRALLPHLQSIVEKADRVVEIARPFDGDSGGESMAYGAKHDKRKGSPYSSGRSQHWLKSKNPESGRSVTKYWAR